MCFFVFMLAADFTSCFKSLCCQSHTQQGATLLHSPRLTQHIDGRCGALTSIDCVKRCENIPGRTDVCACTSFPDCLCPYRIYGDDLELV